MKKTEKNTDFSLIDVLLWGITILLAVVLGIFLDVNNPLIKYLTIPAFVVLRLLVAFAIPMFFLVIINNLITLKFTGKTWYRVLLPLLSNTTFAIIIGFVVVNLIQPGNWADLIPFEFANPTQPTPDFANIDNFWDAILKFIQNLVPASLIEPLVNNNVMQIIVVSFSLGIVLRAIKSEQKQQDKPEFTEEENINFQPLENAIGVLLEAVKNIWKWVIDNHLLKLAVFGILLKNIALQGVVTPLVSLVLFVLTMLVALLVQACYYLLRIQFGSWVKPLEFLCKGRKVFIEAFETASSNRTLDTARQIFKDKIPLREASVYLGVNIGSNFNRDGTIILMVTSVLYISQMLDLRNARRHALAKLQKENTRM